MEDVEQLREKIRNLVTLEDTENLRRHLRNVKLVLFFEVLFVVGLVGSVVYLIWGRGE
jgi:hypothetical protein